MAQEKLVFVFIPSLVAILLNKERTKGTALTEHEVLAIRDEATVVASPPDVAEQMAESRGYRDIDPENCWVEWREIRGELGQTGP